jgi:hypothetical protein
LGFKKDKNIRKNNKSSIANDFVMEEEEDEQWVSPGPGNYL